MKNKIFTARGAAECVKDHDMVMLGGFGKWGYALEIIKSLYEDCDASDLTFVMNSANSKVHIELEKLLESRCKHVICSFMRNSSAIQKLYAEGNVTLVPQGTLAENIRLGGYGVPAYFTPVGVGTPFADGKETRTIDGKPYLFERTLKGQVAMFRATAVDSMGNCYLRGATINFSPLMALACDKVFVEAERMISGALPPEYITIPHILIDGIVKVG